MARANAHCVFDLLRNCQPRSPKRLRHSPPRKRVFPGAGSLSLPRRVDEHDAGRFYNDQGYLLSKGSGRTWTQVANMI